MAFLRSLTPAATAIADAAASASALPATFAFSSSSSSHFPNTKSFCFLSSPSNRLGLTRNSTASPTALNMDSPTSLHNPSQEKYPCLTFF